MPPLTILIGSCTHTNNHAYHRNYNAFPLATFLLLRRGSRARLAALRQQILVTVVVQPERVSPNSLLSSDCRPCLGAGARASRKHLLHIFHRRVFDSELLQCYESVDCFSGFDWSTIAPESSAVFESCFSYLVEDWPNMGGLHWMHDFFNDGSRQQRNGRELFAPTLDRCLVEHDCIGLDGLQLDFPKLRKFIGFSGIASASFSLCYH
jgi:hypothetical protein